MSAKQKLFCDEYLIDLNATQAAIRAGYSTRTAQEIGSENLTKPIIQEYITQRMQEREQRTEITQDRVLQEYARIAFSDPRKFYDDNGNLIPINQLDADIAAILVSFDVQESKSESLTIKKIRIADKMSALDSLARHLGMFNDKLHHSSDVNIRLLEQIVGSPNNRLTID